MLWFRFRHLPQMLRSHSFNSWIFAFASFDSYQQIKYEIDPEYLFSPVKGDGKMERAITEQYFKVNYSSRFNVGRITRPGKSENEISHYINSMGVWRIWPLAIWHLAHHERDGSASIRGKGGVFIREILFAKAWVAWSSASACCQPDEVPHLCTQILLIQYEKAMRDIALSLTKRLARE